MINKDLERIENRMMSIVEQAAPEDACNAAKTLVDVFCQLEELKIREDQYAMNVRQFEEVRGEVKSEEVTPCNVPAAEGDTQESCIQHMLDREYAGQSAVLIDEDSSDFKNVLAAAELKDVNQLIGLERNYTLMEVGETDGHYIALFCGGNNGTPRWGVYLDAVHDIVDHFEKFGMDPWIIQLDNDSPDDVHYVYIGFHELPKAYPAEISTTPELEGYEQDDGSDRWGTRKFRVYIDGMDSEAWRQIKNYVSGYNGSYTAGGLQTSYFWITRSCWGVKECPKGEYKLFEEDVHRLMKDLKALFPGIVDRRGLTWVKR